MGARVDVTGQIFGRLTVLEDQGGGHVLCVCECGNSRTFVKANVTRGLSKSCGCLCKERTSAATSTHGRTGSPEFIVLNGVRQRCLNSKNPNYPNYGGRGITVCDRWQGAAGLENFIADMGLRPEGMTLDRRNNDGPYSPENCRWATRSMQSRNTQRTRLSPEIVLRIRHRHSEGESLSDIARSLGVSRSAVSLANKGKNWRDV